MGAFFGGGAPASSSVVIWLACWTTALQQAHHRLARRSPTTSRKHLAQKGHTVPSASHAGSLAQPSRVLAKPFLLLLDNRHECGAILAHDFDLPKLWRLLLLLRSRSQDLWQGPFACRLAEKLHAPAVLVFVSIVVPLVVRCPGAASRRFCQISFWICARPKHVFAVWHLTLPWAILAKILAPPVHSIFASWAHARPAVLVGSMLDASALAWSETGLNLEVPIKLWHEPADCLDLGPRNIWPVGGPSLLRFRKDKPRHRTAVLIHPDHRKPCETGAAGSTTARPRRP